MNVGTAGLILESLRFGLEANLTLPYSSLGSPVYLSECDGECE